MTVSDPDWVFVDPLAALPDPVDTLSGQRTFPGLPETGVVRWIDQGHGTYWFMAVLPRRYGDVGAIERFGLFANGAWYPQPLDQTGMPIVDWDVTVTLPPGALGVVGEHTGHDRVHWEGTGERASLAVLPHGQVTHIEEDWISVRLVTPGKPRRRWLQELRTQLVRARPEDLAATWSGVVVQAPLRRRLVRPGVGVAYLSDRAFRVSIGLHRYHRVAVTAGLLHTLVDLPDPLHRGLAAGALTQRYQERLRGLSAEGLLRSGSFIPTMNLILTDRRTPFVAEVFEEVYPGDPIEDDLVEVHAPVLPGLALTAQLDDAYGERTAWRVAEQLMLGVPELVVLGAMSLPMDALSRWRRAPPVQDYQLRVGARGTEVTVERVTEEADAPEETVVLTVDGTEHRAVFPEGPGSWSLTLPERARRVRLDPKHHTRQESKLGDRWPARWDVVTAVTPTTINLTELYLEGYAYLTLRRWYDTKNRFTGTLWTDRQTLVGATLRYQRKFGTLRYDWFRPHNLYLSLSPSVLSQGFDPAQDGKFALEATATYTYNSTVSEWFPVQGERVTAQVQGGLVPATGSAWASTRASLAMVRSPHPRHAVSMKLAGDLAWGQVVHRLLPLGGSSGLWSVAPTTFVGRQRFVGNVQYRVAPLRNASVPAIIAWGTELHLAVGLEGGVVFDGAIPDPDDPVDVPAFGDGETTWGLGATAGIGGVIDFLGTYPMGYGVSFSWPLLGGGANPTALSSVPQVYLGSLFRF